MRIGPLPAGAGLALAAGLGLAVSAGQAEDRRAVPAAIGIGLAAIGTGHAAVASPGSAAGDGARLDHGNGAGSGIRIGHGNGAGSGVRIGHGNGAGHGPGVSLSLIETGGDEGPEGIIREGGSIFLKRETTVVAFLVRHPQAVFLFDSGFGKHARPQYDTFPLWAKLLLGFRQTGDTASILAAKGPAVGIDPARISYLIPSHLHWDHASAIKDFPDTEVMVQQSELEFARRHGLDSRELHARGRAKPADSGYLRRRRRREPAIASKGSRPDGQETRHRGHPGS